jgi:hypothetical protein
LYIVFCAWQRGLHSDYLWEEVDIAYAMYVTVVHGTALGIYYGLFEEVVPKKEFDTS